MNFWTGCEKDDTDCKNCYAETLAQRFPLKLGQWGPGTNRPPASEKAWDDPYRWDRIARTLGVKHRVFTLSMGDFFEDRDDLLPLRARAAQIMCRTPNLIWLVLTKRPQNITRLWSEACGGTCDPPPNVWFGASFGNQRTADRRLSDLLRVNAALLFASAEPLIGDVNLRNVSPCRDQSPDYTDALTGMTHCSHAPVRGNRLGWVIVGGESGGGARPCDVQWVERVVGDCQAANVPVFVKQLGRRPFTEADDGTMVPVKLKDFKGRDPAEWDRWPHLQVREVP